MRRLIHVLVVAFLLAAAVAAQPAPLKISTEAEIKADMELVPCKDRNARREEVVRLFKKMGATDAEIVTEKIDDIENVVVTKKGTTEETVIVGAHYDKANLGCGAVDNWTGIVIVANIYRTMRSLTTQKTYKFVGFDKEELGLRGSAAMAGKIPKEKRPLHCAMVNFDSFGFAYPQAKRNLSTDSLLDLAGEVSKEMKLPFGTAGIDTSTSDSASFLKIEIPSIGFHGLKNDWKTYLHTQNDKLENVNIQSVYIAYRHGLVFLSKIESLPCNEFRPKKSGRKN